MGAGSYIRLPSDGDGKRTRTTTVSIDGTEVHQQIAQLTNNSDIIINPGTEETLSQIKDQTDKLVFNGDNLKTESALPTGAATEDTLSQIKDQLDKLKFNGDNLKSEIPLPSDASTATLQGDTNTKLDTIHSDLTSVATETTLGEIKTILTDKTQSTKLIFNGDEVSNLNPIPAKYVDSLGNQVKIIEQNESFNGSAGTNPDDNFTNRTYTLVTSSSVDIIKVYVNGLLLNYISQWSKNDTLKTVTIAPFIPEDAIVQIFYRV